jgi:hypothetical protein
LREQRTLFCDPTGEDFFQEFRDSYDWMCEQMSYRLPEYDGHYPWWAYDHKPDLRRYPQVGDGQFVRLELALAPDRVLLSGYGSWHHVLNFWYLPRLEDALEFEREATTWDDELERHGLNPDKGRLLPEPWSSRMRASWENIFNVNELREMETIQACFECLMLEDVVRVTVFTPRLLPENR